MALRVLTPISSSHHDTVRDLIKTVFTDRCVTGIELGTYNCDLTKVILDRPNVVKLYTVDPFCFDAANHFDAGNTSQEVHDEHRRHAERIAAQDARLELMVMKSDDAFRKLRGQKVDFVWLDGDHEEEQVRRDVANAIALTRSYGFFGGHDEALVWGVTRVLNETLPFYYIGADHTWWYYM